MHCVNISKLYTVFEKTHVNLDPHLLDEIALMDNCIQNFHLWRYIVGYTVGNLVLRRHVSRAVKSDFRPYIRRYTSPNGKFEYDYPPSQNVM